MNRVHTNPQLYSFQQCVRKSYFCKIFDFRKGEGQSYRWFFFVSILCLVLKKIFCGNKCTLVSKIKVNSSLVIKICAEDVAPLYIKLPAVYKGAQR